MLPDVPHPDTSALHRMEYHVSPAGLRVRALLSKSVLQAPQKAPQPSPAPGMQGPGGLLPWQMPCTPSTQMWAECRAFCPSSPHETGACPDLQPAEPTGRCSIHQAWSPRALSRLLAALDLHMLGFWALSCPVPLASPLQPEHLL